MDFDSIYKKHYQELYYFALKQNLLHAEAADVLQDVFTGFYKQLSSNAQIENPKAWLYSVLMNTIRTHSRISKSREIINNEIASRIQTTMDMETDFHKNEKLHIVESCMMQLSTTDKNLLLLYHQGFSYHEISEILQMNSVSVGTCIARATKKLKSILISQYYELFE